MSSQTVRAIPWHIIQRGNNRSACFFANENYQFYLDVLKEQAEKFDCAIHAYVLMTNHAHLSITPEKTDSAALLMKKFGQRYVHAINRSYRRSGTLWEGRFRSCLTQSEDYVLVCYRYIELNPVRAAMVDHPRNYKWSSYCANAEGRKNDLLTSHDQYLRISRNEEGRRKGYRALFKAYVEQQIDDQIRDATNGSFALGHSQFREEVEKMIGRRVTKGKAGQGKRKLVGKRGLSSIFCPRYSFGW